MQQVCNIFLQFLAYSFLGWTCETIYCSIGQGKFVNRGFLNGPLCPVYGFGAMAVLVFLRPIQNNIPLLFLCGMLVTSVIEYITGYLLENCLQPSGGTIPPTDLISMAGSACAIR